MTTMQSLQHSKEWQEIQKKYKGEREKASTRADADVPRVRSEPSGRLSTDADPVPRPDRSLPGYHRVLATSPLQLVDLAPRVYLPGLAALITIE